MELSGRILPQHVQGPSSISSAEKGNWEATWFQRASGQMWGCGIFQMVTWRAPLRPVAFCFKNPVFGSPFPSSPI